MLRTAALRQPWQPRGRGMGVEGGRGSQESEETRIHRSSLGLNDYIIVHTLGMWKQNPGHLQLNLKAINCPQLKSQQSGGRGWQISE